MPDASPHCKRLSAAPSGVLTERPAAKGVAKTRNAPKALVEIEVVSRAWRPRYTGALFARS